MNVKDDKLSRIGYDMFCEKCDNILDITRTQNKMTSINSTTPLDVSTDDDNVDYEKILKKVENEEKLSRDELMSIDMKEIVKNEYYKKMAKKGEVKKMILEMLEDMGNSDDNIQAFMVCKNCGFTKYIDPRVRILSRNPEKMVSHKEYINDTNYRLKTHIRTMPITRNFNCSNKNCPSNTGKIEPEAVFFRKNADSYDTMYVCRRCLTIKIN